MDEPNNSMAVRAIVWVRDAAWRRAVRALPLRVIEVESGYEVLAELLAARPAASPAVMAGTGPVVNSPVVVAELSLLSPRHVRLVEIARQRGVEVLGLGSPHPSVSVVALSGVRLISPDDLAAAVGRLAAADAVFHGRPAGAAGHERVTDAVTVSVDAAAGPLAVFTVDPAGLPEVEMDEELAAAIEADRQAAADRRAAVQGWGDLAATPSLPPTGSIPPAEPVSPPAAVPAVVIPSGTYVSAAGGGNGHGNGSGTGQHSRDAGVSPARLAGILPASGEDGLTSSSGPANGTHNAGGTPTIREDVSSSPQPSSQDARPPRGLLTREELAALLEDSR